VDGNAATDGAAPEAGSCPNANTLGAGINAWILFDDTDTDLTRHLYAIRPDGCGLRRVTTATDDETEPVFSPDGTRIAFTSTRGGSAPHIFVLSLSSGVVRGIASGMPGVMHPAWSPDGTQLAFDDGKTVFYVDALTPNATPVAVTAGKTGAFEYPSFLPDGQSLILDLMNAVSVYKLDGTLLLDVIVGTTATMAQVSLSPDGTKGALIEGCGGIGPDPYVKSVWVVPVGQMNNPCTGTRITSVTMGDFAHPSMGPLGSVAAALASSPAKLLLFKDGQSAPLAATPGHDAANPSFSPVGAMLP
jgi:hypothetical protein